jgi:hypothetical protein
VKGRLVAALWLLVSLAVWNGFFDLYVSRGAREYLQLAAEAQLGRGPVPSMTGVMARARHDGLVASTIWASVVLVAGWGTVWIFRQRR